MSDNLTTKELILKVEQDLKDDFNDKISELTKSIDKMWVEIDKLKNRLPNWAVILISTLTALLGFFIKS